MTIIKYNPPLSFNALEPIFSSNSILCTGFYLEKRSIVLLSEISRIFLSNNRKLIEQIMKEKNIVASEAEIEALKYLDIESKIIKFMNPSEWLFITSNDIYYSSGDGNN